MKFLLSATALIALLATGADAADPGRTIAVDCPINNCEDAISLTFAGEFAIETGTTIDGVEIGGISGIDYDAGTGHYIAISDDRSQKAPARFYELDIKAGSGGIDHVSVVRTVTLKDKDGSVFAEKTVDPEQIRLFGDNLIWSSEGDGKAMIAPFVRITSANGDFVRAFTLPEGFAPSEDHATGIRNNNAFESIALLPEGDVLVANEAALYQDGPASTLTTASPARIVRYDTESGEPTAQYIYMIDPIPHAPVDGGEWNDNGLSDMMPLDDTRLLVSERSFAQNRGFTIRIFLIDLDGATDVSAIASLRDSEEAIVPVAKSLILDLGAIGLQPDNIEAMTIGRTEDGAPLLLLASDNNFNAEQKTQFLAFTIENLPGVGR
ncbi:esterase-like activity of phytase family protein [Martelella soudanensis]|uniref:esterase-like activity of phytase family protein n=1 Tax=unclassified Martelella TaxID=2629616 RepID=UPI0015DE114F|nr:MULTISPECIES: esterase-like activity of phytase family protein [unclassified Martelella]